MAPKTEALLSAWLRLSTSIDNSRVVKELSLNETLVCNALFRHSISCPDSSLTATDLCAKTKMLKSQMNRTLNMLEEKGMITRCRSTTDRRQVYISLNAENLELYETQHRRILRILEEIANELGEERIEEVINLFNHISDIADNVLS